MVFVEVSSEMLGQAGRIVGLSVERGRNPGLFSAWILE